MGRLAVRANRPICRIRSDENWGPIGLLRVIINDISHVVPFITFLPEMYRIDIGSKETFARPHARMHAPRYGSKDTSHFHAIPRPHGIDDIIKSKSVVVCGVSPSGIWLGASCNAICRSVKMHRLWMSSIAPFAPQPARAHFEGRSTCPYLPVHPQSHHKRHIYNVLA